MKRTPTRVLLMLLLTLAVAGLGQAIASESEGDTPRKPRNRWQPPEVDRSAYRDIVDFNIFRSDRKRLADQADRDRNPPPSETSEPAPVQEIEKTPPNPDSLLRLTGIAHTPQGVVAFIEHTTSGELSRLTGPERFAQGEVTDIGLRSVLYVVADEQREINIGETFVGERVVPAGYPVAGTDNPSSGNTSNLSPAERLRLLREKRARELGTTPPTETPAPADTPDAPDTPEKNAPSQPDPEIAATSTGGTPNETNPIPAGSDAGVNKP